MQRSREAVVNSLSSKGLFACVMLYHRDKMQFEKVLMKYPSRVFELKAELLLIRSCSMRCMSMSDYVSQFDTLCELGCRDPLDHDPGLRSSRISHGNTSISSNDVSFEG